MFQSDPNNNNGLNKQVCDYIELNNDDPNLNKLVKNDQESIINN